MPLAIGAVLENRYRIDALLGEGGMGAVYRARHLRIQQDVAIKENRMASPASARQFEREAVVMAGLRHPNLPRVIDHFVLADGAQYLVMDYIEGHDLSQILAHSGPLDEARAVAWIERICDALAYLHSQQPPVIHRDIKPSNIKITPRGEVYLVDFGIAKVGGARARTSTGALGVTDGFSPLEQYGSGGTDARSDIYALGATLYALLTGQNPPDSVEIASGGATLTPPADLAPGLSVGVASALEAALRTKPTDRPQTVAAFRRLLRERAAPVPAASRQSTVLRDTAPPAGSRPPGPAAQHAQGARQSASRSATPQARPARPDGKGARAIPSWGWWAAGVVVVALAVGLWIAWPRGSVEETPTPPPPSREPTAQPTDLPTEAAPEPTTPPTREPTQEPTLTGPALGDTWTRPADRVVMVYVPTGEFEMGSDDGDGDEQPVHTVALDALWIDQMEVTNDQYRRCVEAGECDAPLTCELGEPTYADTAKGDHPVVCVDWQDAAAYCEWTGARLPTEAEWEYAARGPQELVFPWGNQFDGSRLNYCDANCEFNWKDAEHDDEYSRTAPVGSYPDGASWCGALDLAGNVWEWGNDWYDSEYYRTSPSRNPQGPTSGEARIVRGGSWGGGSGGARGANRHGVVPGGTNNSLGFRCARGSS